jgi:hypothetical protein
MIWYVAKVSECLESPLIASCLEYLRFKDIGLNFVDVIQLFVLALLVAGI